MVTSNILPFARWNVDKKPHRVNARLTAKEYERAREILASHKIYGVHSISDVVSKAIWDLYDRLFNIVLGEEVPFLQRLPIDPESLGTPPAIAKKKPNSRKKPKALKKVKGGKK